MGLCDVWRLLHGQEKGYSYYSAIHDMHSRLDYFLTTAEMLQRIQLIEYRARRIGDHAPLQMVVSMGLRPPGNAWCMHTWRLLNTKVAEDLEQVTQRYFAENTGSVQSPIVLW
ncbi:hypothetical protein NDU88_000372 [Pleurodeles waltl]|uniref:Uncharacterized protein n=1 Tax=Pleurodeles waltl TaxID=8319 RepID=A0AAV7VTX5_PLEWA|nr:hypothetical protein NDU88_000372 [Pleurodeles waltl]